jgi:hypothetical protein
MLPANPLSQGHRAYSQLQLITHTHKKSVPCHPHGPLCFFFLLNFFPGAATSSYSLFCCPLPCPAVRLPRSIHSSCFTLKTYLFHVASAWGQCTRSSATERLPVRSLICCAGCPWHSPLDAGTLRGLAGSAGRQCCCCHCCCSRCHCHRCRTCTMWKRHSGRIHLQAPLPVTLLSAISPST